MRGALSGSRDLVRIAHRDPEHVAERLTLYATERLGEPSRAWAEAALEANPEASPRDLADKLRSDTAKVARVDGAIAGTPFFIALVPGYMAYLWQEARMGLRTAALFGTDPTSSHTAAEMLALRGVHPDAESAAAALQQAREHPVPDKPEERRPLMLWVRSIYMILVFGGFLSPPSTEERPSGVRARLIGAAGILGGVIVWGLTWVAPVTLMIALAWGCESHARQLGRRALALYDGETGTAAEAIAAADEIEDEGHDKRQIVRTLALTLSFAIPLAFVAYVDHVRNTTGVNWLGAIGALVAVAVVIAATVIANRR